MIQNSKRNRPCGTVGALLGVPVMVVVEGMAVTAVVPSVAAVVRLVVRIVGDNVVVSGVAVVVVGSVVVVVVVLADCSVEMCIRDRLYIK